MPKIPVMTAQGQGAMLRLPSANAEALGGQAGLATIGFGQVLTQIDQALQDQRDKLDLAALESDYQAGLDSAYQDALKEPDIQKQPMAFAKSVDALHGDLMKRPLSNAVRTTFQVHKERLDSQAVINLRHEGRKLETERQVVETTQAAEQRMDQAARYSQLSGDSKNVDIRNLAGMANALVTGLEQNRHLSPIDAQKMREGLQDRYWSEFARQHPEEMLAMRAGGPTADRPTAMDWQKLTHYEQVATAEITRLNSAANAAEKKLAEEAKAQSQSVVAEYFSRSALPDHDPQALLEEAARDPRLSSTDKPEAVRYLQSRADHAASAAKNGTKFDERFFLRTLLPNIWNGKYKDELDVLKAGGDHLDASHATQAIEQFHKYNTTVTTPVKQAFQFGEDVIRQAFALPPGATIDAAGVGDAKGRAMDRFTTWYGDLVQRASVEGPKVFDGIDIQAQARKYKDEELVALDDNVIRILETKPPQYKSEEEIRKAYEGGKIASTREVNRALAELESYQHLQQRAAKRTKVNPSDKRIEK